MTFSKDYCDDELKKMGATKSLATDSTELMDDLNKTLPGFIARL